jgi:MoaA/NifB/PqqE/SkfB family radical SAM enzyme/GT2 family glycosyltransferase
MDAISNSIVSNALTASTPRSLWIELTSVCPFDCVFCSRRMRHGHGEHMDFALYERIIAQLDRPEVIRLNYSGESIHYPRLKEAIVLAKGTGARVELVTALASASRQQIESLVEAGLDRLTISLHALDPELYQRIYRFSSAERLIGALGILQARKVEGGSVAPRLDLSFVAMADNLGELPRLAEFAASAGIAAIAVHPVIRRDLIPILFEAELHNGSQLRPEFLQRIEAMAEVARSSAPSVDIQIARAAEPQRHAGHTGFATCEQNPWETAHILANGDVVACEVQDHLSLGSLATHSLDEVWHGPAYEEFRARYGTNRDAICRDCAWYVFTPASQKDPVFLRGWHRRSDGDAVHWSERRAAIWIPTLEEEARFGMTGVLLPGSIEEPSRVEIFADGHRVGRVENKTEQMKSFDFSAYLPVLGRKREGGVLFSFECSRTYCPAEATDSRDLRRLGFGLHSLELNPPPAPRKGNRWKYWLAGLLVGRRGKVPVPTTSALGPGVSVVIPESGTPEVLAQCLAALAVSGERVNEPVEIVVWVNGARAADYAELRQLCPAVRFHFVPKRQGYSAAVHAALGQARYSWTYLLNSDAMVEPLALDEVMRLRAPDRFAIASQIHSEGADERRIESNWTRVGVEDGLVHTWDAFPVPAEAVEMPYAGGTAALYQTAVLRQLAERTMVYDPFYWEDVEWGFAAARAGLTCWIAPGSVVRHMRRTTVNKLYDAAEVERVFERNRLLFQLRGVGPVGDGAAVRQALALAPWRTLLELFSRARGSA